MTTNHDFVNLLLTQQGADYEFGAENDAADPNSPKHRGTDCSEFGEWGCDRLGVNPPYPDGTWNQVSWIRDHGLLVPIDSALRTVGAALFHFKGDPFKGTRPAEAHTAYSLGDYARTIEARGEKYGTGIFGGAPSRAWTHAGLIPGITYVDLDLPHVPPTTGSSKSPSFPGRVMKLTSKPYMRGADVRSVQTRLKQRGWRIDVDGIYGTETYNVVRKFQAEKRLEPDGKVGPATWQALWTAPIT